MGTWTALIKQWWFVPVGLLVGWLWLRTHDAQVKYQALAEERVEMIKTLGQQRDSTYIAMIKKDSLIEVQKTIIENARTKLRVESGRVAAETKEAVAELRAQLSESQQTELDSVVSKYERQLQLERAQMQKTVELHLLAERQVAQKDSVINKMRDDFRVVEQTYFEEVRRNKPSLGDKAMKALPWLITAAAILTR